MLVQVAPERKYFLFGGITDNGDYRIVINVHCAGSG
jgi:hypothetical protein